MGPHFFFHFLLREALTIIILILKGEIIQLTSI